MSQRPPEWPIADELWPRVAHTHVPQWMAVKVINGEGKRAHAPWGDDPKRRLKWARDATENWTDFEQAYDWYDKVPSCPALAFIMQSPDDPYREPADPFLFIDGDNVRLDDGRVHPSFAALIEGLGETYAEVSVSGTGVHVLYEGELPSGHETGFSFDLPDHPDFAGFDDQPSVEVYHGKRVCVCTGKRVQLSPAEIREVDAESLEGLAALVDEGTDPSVSEAPPVDDAAVDEAQSTPATRDFDVLDTAIEGLTIDDVRLNSTVTDERSDGWVDMDPSFAASESGKRIGVGPDRRRVIYRDGNHGGDVLSLIAWEERLCDPGETLRGRAFWDAVRAARDRGAPLPSYAPPEDEEQEQDQKQKLSVNADGSAWEHEHEPEVAASVTAPESEPGSEPEQSESGESAGTAPDRAVQRGPSWETIRVFFDDDDVEYKDAVRDLVSKLSTDESWMAHRDNPHMLYWYNPERGIYEEHGDTRIGEILERELPRHNSTRLKGELKYRLRAKSWYPREEVGGSLEKPLVSVENGVVDLETGAFMDHSPERPFIRQVHASYNPEADCPNFDAFLDSVLDDDDHKQLVYELLGHAIHPGYVDAGFAIFHGDGSNGKSTLLTMMKRWLGKENTAAYDVQDFADNDFAVGGLYGKMANFGGDLPSDALTRSGALKKLSAGDTVTYNRKNQAQFPFESEATLVFAANDPPAIEDDSNAIYRRLMEVNFPYEFTDPSEPGPDAEPEQEIYDRCLTDEERSGILNRAVEAAKGLRRSGFSQKLSVGERRHQYKKSSDPIYAFVAEALRYVENPDEVDGNPVVGGEPWLTTDSLYSAFIEWCRENRAPHKDKNVFAQRMATHIGGKVEKKRRKVRGGRKNGYEPIEWTTRGRQLAGLEKPGESGQTGLDV